MTVMQFTRQPRRAACVAAAFVAAVAVGYGVGVASAADPRLDEADAALQKTQALLEASQAGVVSAQAQHRFDKAVGAQSRTSRTLERRSPRQRWPSDKSLTARPLLRREAR